MNIPTIGTIECSKVRMLKSRTSLEIGFPNFWLYPLKPEIESRKPFSSDVRNFTYVCKTSRYCKPPYQLTIHPKSDPMVYRVFRIIH